MPTECDCKWADNVPHGCDIVRRAVDDERLEDGAKLLLFKMHLKRNEGVRRGLKEIYAGEGLGWISTNDPIPGSEPRNREERRRRKGGRL